MTNRFFETSRSFMMKLYKTKCIRNFRFFLPLPSIFPISDFHSRLFAKANTILKWSLLHRVGISGAKDLNKTVNGNEILMLNSTSALGEKGDLIALPKDQVIFRYVKRFGEWEPFESSFLSNLAFLNQHHKIVFLDLGGQAGIITRQYLNKSIEFTELSWIIEPLLRHRDAIAYNCSKWVQKGELKIFPYALDRIDLTKKMYVEKNNSGNASLLDYLPISRGKSVETIKTKKVKRFEEIIFKPNVKYLIKSDIQGMDAEVLSLFSEKFWGQSIGGVVEIWALPSVNKEHVEKLIQMWQCFDTFSWDSSLKIGINLEEVKDFWLSGSGATKNLFITKSN
jgi:hypothetical protein